MNDGLLNLTRNGPHPSIIAVSKIEERVDYL